jgi:hypothetical protein
MAKVGIDRSTLQTNIESHLSGGGLRAGGGLEASTIRRIAKAISSAIDRNNQVLARQLQEAGVL